ncbi:HEAT repeat domain-containing protein [Longispora albida]|uniref:HEAT repeat domain-containing protein n=1 Tax=Longispora albida TaxID=203523 RepID=UPI0003827790|nr:HEAT repeat domain-containing protein [Longispora albida]
MNSAPADNARLAASRWGRQEVAARCAAILHGTEDAELTVVIGGLHGRAVEAGTTKEGDWPRVWAARALLYVWDEPAAPAVVAALGDPQWRVREMAAKVAARRELGEAAETLAGLLADPVPRVRAAACRALAVTGESEHAPGLHALLSDPDPDVRTRAEQALGTLEHRLDRADL